MTYLCLILLLSLADASVAPALYHVDRFPQDRATIGTLLEFNRHYRQHLCRLQLIHPDSPTLSIICCETDWLHHVWDLLRDAKYIYYTSSVRRTLMLTILDYILGGFVGACTIAVAVLLDAILQTNILEADREVGR